MSSIFCTRVNIEIYDFFVNRLNKKYKQIVNDHNLQNRKFKINLYKIILKTIDKQINISNDRNETYAINDKMLFIYLCKYFGYETWSMLFKINSKTSFYYDKIPILIKYCKNPKWKDFPGFLKNNLKIIESILKESNFDNSILFAIYTISIGKRIIDKEKIAFNENSKYFNSQYLSKYLYYFEIQKHRLGNL